MNTIPIKNNIINLDHVRKLSYQAIKHTKPVDDETKYFEIEFTFTNGDTASYEMTYEKFQKILGKYDDDITFVIDDKLNTGFYENIQ